MLTLNEWMELADYKITEHREYLWSCFGEDAYNLTSWSGTQDGYSFNIIFDTTTQIVYAVEACDYKNDKAYRIINEDYRAAYDAEGNERGHIGDQAWDDVDFVDLESDDDFIHKAFAIKEGKDYDTRISVPLDLSNDEMFELMKMAHERDMTLNNFVADVVTQFCERLANDPQELERLKSQFKD